MAIASDYFKSEFYQVENTVIAMTSILISSAHMLFINRKATRLGRSTILASINNSCNSKTVRGKTTEVEPDGILIIARDELVIRSDSLDGKRLGRYPHNH